MWDGADPSHKGALFLFDRKLRSLSNKTVRGMRTRTKWKFVAKATVLGASVLEGQNCFLGAESDS